MAAEESPIDIISRPLTLPCGLRLANRLVKCPMQETLARPPHRDPPVDAGFRPLYGAWAGAGYGLLVTGQVQVDRRFLSVAGDVVVHERSLEEPHLGRWRGWARAAQRRGTPCLVQLSHPGRMSPAGAGDRPPGGRALCPSEVPVRDGGWLGRLALGAVFGTPRAMTAEEIDEVVAAWVRGAVVAREAGFAGCQIHGAHGFLLSQFLSPHTNRRTDEYGGTPQKRMKLLQRLVAEIRAACPPPYCLSVKLNSADYMEHGGLGQDEALEQVRWLVESGMVDLVEISGGNAESKTSRLHNSFDEGGPAEAPGATASSPSTRTREGYFAEFAERVQALGPAAGAAAAVPIQLSGGFRSRAGMAEAIGSGACALVGLGRAAVLEPDLPARVLLDPGRADDGALAAPHAVRGRWLARAVPARAVGAGLVVRFFYYNMRRIGRGLEVQPDASIPFIVAVGVWESLSGRVSRGAERLLACFGGRGATSSKSS